MSILLIEDDEFFRKFYYNKLKDVGYEVFGAGDGVEGIEKIRKHKPDLILLDIIMPKMDGFGVLKAISQDKGLSKIPVIVFSTLGQEHDVKRAKSLGAKDYINKSFFDFDILLGKIQALMKK